MTDRTDRIPHSLLSDARSRDDEPSEVYTAITSLIDAYDDWKDREAAQKTLNSLPTFSRRESLYSKGNSCGIIKRLDGNPPYKMEHVYLKRLSEQESLSGVIFEPERLRDGALAFAVLGEYELAPGESAVVLGSELSANREHYEKEYSDLVSLLPVIYDVNSAEAHVEEIQVAQPMSPHGKMMYMPRYKYTLEPPKDYLMIQKREELLTELTEVFNKSFIAPYNRNEKRTGKNMAKNKVFNLLNAMTLGKLEFPINFFDKFKCEKWKRGVLSRLAFADLDDPDYKKAKSIVSVARDIVALWDDKSRDCRFAIRVNRSELDDVDAIIPIFEEYAEFIGIDSYIDAYLAGVPIEDILY